jgi:hypothetical protein
MKLKLAIVFGILIWFLTYIITEFLNPIFIDNMPYVNIIIPLSTIIITGFFGILYIRSIETNEVVEGILGGIIFIIVDVVCDFIFLILPNHKALIIDNYPLHIISVTILTLLITTFLGYLAQMNIDLK